jgi:hypothetical protein
MVLSSSKSSSMEETETLCWAGTSEAGMSMEAVDAKGLPMGMGMPRAPFELAPFMLAAAPPFAERRTRIWNDPICAGKSSGRQ